MAIVPCRECAQGVSAYAPACPRCGFPNPGGNGDRPLRVEVRDVDMKMGSMVTFMVKWSVASIPALIILFMIAMIMAGVFGGLGASLLGGY